MAFTAKLYLEEGDTNGLNILFAGYEFVQPLDSENHPKGIPKANVLKIVLESSKDTRLIEWMVKPLMTKSIKVVFSGDQGSAFRTIEMKDAYCVGYRELFDHNNAHPMTITLRVAALELKADTKADDPSSNIPVTSFKMDEPPAPPSLPTVPTMPTIPDVPEAPADIPVPNVAMLEQVPSKLCTKEGEPVDVASGRMLSEETDIELPGPIPFVWKRTWYSSSDYQGPLGSGWHHGYELSLTVKKDNVIYRTDDGRDVAFPLLAPNETHYKRSGKLSLRFNSNHYTIFNHEEELEYGFEFNGYLQKHLLKSIFDADGYAIRFEYNDYGILIKITDSGGRLLIVENNSNGKITQLSLQSENTDGKLQTLVSYQYNNYGCLIAIANALGHKRQFIYNPYRQIIEHVTRSGIHFYFEYDGVDKDAKCTRTWGDGNVMGYQFSYFPKEEKTLSTNSLGFTTIYYHKNGLVIEKVDPLGNKTQIAYNSFSEVAMVTDAQGNTTKNFYDDRGNIIETILPNGATERFNYVNDLLLSEKDIDGGDWRYEYDDEGHLIKQTDPLGQVTTYIYNNGQIAEFSDAAQNITFFNYNAQGLLAWIVEPNGQKTSWEYNQLGECTATIYPNGTIQRMYYDEAQQVIKIDEPDGNVRHITYNAAGDPLLVSDNDGRILFGYDEVGNMISRTEGNETTKFIYDTEQQLIGIINPHNEKYVFELNGNGQTIKEASFDGVTLIFQRNATGLIKKVERPGGRSTTYSYDDLGQIARVEYEDGGFEEYEYNIGGDVLSISNNEEKVIFEYDPLGQLLTQTTSKGFVTNQYGKLGELLQTTSSLGADIRYSRNTMGDVTKLSTTGWLANIGRTAEGWETSRLLPGNVENRWQIDQLGRPITQSVTKSGNPKSILDKKLMWGTNNVLAQMADGLTGNKTTYQYNDRLYLTGAKHTDETLPEVRIADGVGNLFKSFNQSDRKYGKGSSLLESNGTTFTYDAEGNLLTKKDSDGNLWQYEWNSAGMLVKAILPNNNEVAFGYDGLGRRIWKKFKNTITKWLWDEDKPLHEWKEFDTKESSPDDLITWIFEDNNFAPSAKLKGDKKYSIINDYLGTPIQAYNENGDLIWERQLDIYGNIKMLKGDIGFCNYLYQGQMLDSETGLVYNRFRYYSPEEGVYISKDPIGLVSEEYNLYAYVPDTNSWVDIFGLGKGTGYAHVTYRGIKNGKSYTGYASAPTSLGLSAAGIIKRRYGSNFSNFGGIAPKHIYYGTGIPGKNAARGLEHHFYKKDVRRVIPVANKQRPVGKRNKNRHVYKAAALAAIKSKACKAK